jgi:hypothetical protein
MEFFELAFTKTFGPGSSPSLRLASALFGGQDDKSNCKTMSEVASFDLDRFRQLATSFKPADHGNNLDGAELIGGLLAAAIASSRGLEAKPEDEFARACDGMCVSNTMREAGFAPLRAASRWITETVEPNALDVAFAPVCAVEPVIVRLYAQVWQDFQLPGTTAAPAWSVPRRKLALALAQHFESSLEGNGLGRSTILADTVELVGRPRPPVKGSVLSAPGVLEVPPPLRRQVMSLLEVTFRLLSHSAPLETETHLQELFTKYPALQEALSESVLSALTPQKPAKKQKEKKK